MLFEEVLPLMREGKKARQLSDEDGGHWICGKIGNPDLGMPFSETIFKLYKDGRCPIGKDDWAIARCRIMATDWEIIDERL